MSESIKPICVFLLIIFGTAHSATFDVNNVKNSALNFVSIGQKNNKAPSVNDVSCGEHKLTPTENLRLSTPFASYGVPVAAGYQCTWEFYGADGCTPSISCADQFGLPESANCSGLTNLEITDGFSASHKYCGNKAPINVTTGSTVMQVIFANMAPPTGPPPKGFICIVSCAVKSSQSNYQVVSNPVSTPTPANCKCGVPGTSPSATPPATGRVVGGKAAKPLYWKWQVSLVPKTRRSPFCGGSLINDRFVLTAAHCVVTTGLVGFPAAADVVLNDYDIKNSTETITIRRSILKAYPHPFYNAINQDYDYALVEFEPVNLTSQEEPKVTPVCLPPRASTETYVGVIGTVTGWGTTSEGGSQPDVLQEADIPIISNEECNKFYENKITARMLCAAYPEGKIDSCQGDSGGPFVVNNDGVYTKVGVVSFGEGCARAGKPGVYSRVTEANDWIRLITRKAVYCQS